MTEKNRCRRTRQRSGSKRSPRVVDPVMSAKRTVTSLRSSITLSPTAAPQAGQKRAPAGTSAEQRGHAPSTTTFEAYTPDYRGASVTDGGNPSNPEESALQSAGGLDPCHCHLSRKAQSVSSPSSRPTFSPQGPRSRPTPP